MSQIIRVGIIGTGNHGSRYANHIVSDLGDRFTLSAISRRSEIGAKQAKEWRARWFDDWRELIRWEDVDVVVSVTTPNLNHEIAQLAADYKKPLLLEKPLATDYQAGQKIVDRFHQEELGLTIGQTLRYNGVILALKEKLASMGELFSLTACQRLEPSSIDWLEDPEIAGGGVIFHTAVHMFDALRFITGLEIIRIRGSVRSILNPNLEDLLTAEVELSNGVLGLLDTSKVSPARSGSYEFVCQKGQLHGDQIHGGVQRIDNAVITELDVIPPGPAIVPLLKDWHSFLRGAGENPVPGEEGLAAVKICHACRESVLSGDWVAC